MASLAAFIKGAPASWADDTGDELADAPRAPPDRSGGGFDDRGYRKRNLRANDDDEDTAADASFNWRRDDAPGAAADDRAPRPSDRGGFEDGDPRGRGGGGAAGGGGGFGDRAPRPSDRGGFEQGDPRGRGGGGFDRRGGAGGGGGGGGGGGFDRFGGGGFDRRDRDRDPRGFDRSGGSSTSPAGGAAAGGRPRLALQRRTKPVVAEQPKTAAAGASTGPAETTPAPAPAPATAGADNNTTQAAPAAAARPQRKKVNPFGDAKPVKTKDVFAEPAAAADKAGGDSAVAASSAPTTAAKPAAQPAQAPPAPGASAAAAGGATEKEGNRFSRFARAEGGGAPRRTAPTGGLGGGGGGVYRPRHLRNQGGAAGADAGVRKPGTKAPVDPNNRFAAVALSRDSDPPPRAREPRVGGAATGGASAAPASTSPSSGGAAAAGGDGTNTRFTRPQRDLLHEFPRQGNFSNFTSNRGAAEGPEGADSGAPTATSNASGRFARPMDDAPPARGNYRDSRDSRDSRDPRDSRDSRGPSRDMAMGGRGGAGGGWSAGGGRFGRSERQSDPSEGRMTANGFVGASGAAAPLRPRPLVSGSRVGGAGGRAGATAAAPKPAVPEVTPEIDAARKKAILRRGGKILDSFLVDYSTAAAQTAVKAFVDLKERTLVPAFIKLIFTRATKVDTKGDRSMLASLLLAIRSSKKPLLTKSQFVEAVAAGAKPGGAERKQLLTMALKKKVLANEDLTPELAELAGVSLKPAGEGGDAEAVPVKSTESAIATILESSKLGDELAELAKAECKGIEAAVVQPLFAAVVKQQHAKGALDTECAWSAQEQLGAALTAVCDTDAKREMAGLRGVVQQWFELGQPKVISYIFMQLYQNDVITPAGFAAFKNDVDDETPGRSKAFFKLNRWYEWMEAEDSDDDSDEDSSSDDDSGSDEEDDD